MVPPLGTYFPSTDVMERYYLDYLELRRTLDNESVSTLLLWERVGGECPPAMDIHRQSRLDGERYCSPA